MLAWGQLAQVLELGLQVQPFGLDLRDLQAPKGLQWAQRPALEGPQALSPPPP